MEGSNSRENKLVQNAMIGQQDISKFYKDTTTKQIFSKVSKLCEIGQYFSEKCKSALIDVYISGLPMEAYLILIHIVLFSSDNTHLENKAEVENYQTYYMLFLHR